MKVPTSKGRRGEKRGWERGEEWRKKGEGSKGILLQGLKGTWIDAPAF